MLYKSKLNNETTTTEAASAAAAIVVITTIIITAYSKQPTTKNQVYPIQNTVAKLQSFYIAI